MRLSICHKLYLVYLGVLLSAIHNYSSGQEKYLHFSELNGLPRNITTCLEQDKYGYLWIGTGNGIARYDGKNFNSYPELTGMGVSYLLCDTRGNLWVAASEGLYKYDRITNFFEPVVQGFITKIQEDQGEIYFLMISNIYQVKDDSSRLVFSENNLTDFCFSKEGIWIGNSNDGVSLLSRESGFKEISSSFLNEKEVALVSKINDKLFVGCYNGQLYAIPEDGRPIEVAIMNHYFFRKIVKIEQEIWLATDGNGIIILDKDLRYLKTLQRNENTYTSINSNSIYDIYPGSNQEIWIASYGAGLTCILPDNLMFRNILPEKGNDNSLVANEGVSVFIKKPLVYFGTNYGLSTWNEPTQEFKNLSSGQLRKELNGTKVTALFVDQQNTIWIGTYDGLLGHYSADYILIKTYHPSSIDPDEMQRIVILKEIPDNHLLIVTQFQSNILLNFDRTDGTSQVFELYSKGSQITYCLLNSLRKNRRGELLALISNQGLFHVNYRDNILENRLQAMNMSIGCYISDFYPDKKGNYWFASSDNGLLRISEDGKQFRKWTVKDGLPSNTLIRIESTDDRFLWISAITGIFRFDTQTHQVLNFNLNDGLPANEFLERVSAKTGDGRIIFGSIAGYTIVDPGKVTPDTSKTGVIISDITFQNQSIRSPHGKQFLKEPLEDTKELRLPFSKNSFSIHFFAKDKVFLKYHNYAFRLIGFEKDWTYVGEANYATYTNLRPGTYTFEIKTADKSKEGIPTRLTIHIISPWYLRWFAFAAYSIIIITILYLTVYAYLKRIELRKEKEMSEFKIQKEHELTEKKLEFFTNISHDLKTPLTLINAPVSDLLHSENLNQEQLGKLMIINRNSKRLYKLISDLLDFRKITQKQYKLEVKECSISAVISDAYEAFIEECKKKSIDIKYNVDRDLTGFMDVKIIEKIVWNLLSNALKFTNSGGTISLSAEEIAIDGSRNIKIVVSDTGVGIPERDKNKIFERFYKVINSKTAKMEGTGIGLSIVKDLVDLHHGIIRLESVLDKGSTFEITVPSDSDSYTYNELAVLERSDQKIPVIDSTEIPEMHQQTDIKHNEYNLQRILVVEDNTELRDYLTGHFKNKYKVSEAEDGITGLKAAKEFNPDVILTDILMPNMNGYEFCKEIRHNFDTSHIPIIMLTASNTIEQQIKGLSIGADAYLTKPFDIKLLDTQVNALLENRKALRHKFMGIETPENLEKNLPQRDIDFIVELRLFIEENLMDQNLSLEVLSEHFAVSHAQLHRKIKSLTDSTPNNIIKSVRLKKAYRLIREKGMRVSEAAYQTGFNDPNYFTTCFKKEFGQNPSQVGLL
jgi:signal transduction histidine kinase/DNA-binding response OmpR family regulator/ligand-binding sensor domain-containing protein